MFGMGFALPLEARGIVASAPVNPTYAEVLRDTYGADAVWPLVDISSGTTIFETVNSNRDGTLTGWDLQNTAGPVAGTLAPYSDGVVGNYGDIYTMNGLDGLDDIFNGQELSISLWVKIPAGAWTDGVNRRILYLQVDTSNQLNITKFNASNSLLSQYIAGGITKQVTHPTSNTNWINIAVTASLLNDEYKLYINGLQTGSTQTGLGTWLGSLNFARTLIGTSLITQPSHLGHLAYFSMRFGNPVWTAAEILNIYNAASTAAPD